MRAAVVFSLVIVGVITIGIPYDVANAELGPNNSFILEGAGFAVTEKSIKNSEIDFAIATGNQRGSTINMLIEDGFLTVNEDEFLVSDLQASGLREGRYIRVSGTAEDSLGEQISFRFFGRLVDNSADGSIYGFTGSLSHGGETHKIIYTTKLSGLESTTKTITITEQPKSDTVVRILKGSSNIGIASSYIDLAQTQDNSPTRANYFSPTRVTIEPGTAVTFVNEDTVSHRIVSGTGLSSNSRIQGTLQICETPQKELRPGSSTSGSGCAFSFDGRIDSGIIEPGKSWTATFKDMGFYRIIDPNYPWMNIVVYSFPDTGSEVIRRVGNNPYGN